MTQHTSPRRVSTGPLRKLDRPGMWGNGYAYRLLGGPALFIYAAAVAKVKAA